MENQEDPSQEFLNFEKAKFLDEIKSNIVSFLITMFVFNAIIVATSAYKMGSYNIEDYVIVLIATCLFNFIGVGFISFILFKNLNNYNAKGGIR